MKTSGYSINILPSGTEYARFDSIIKQLANKYKTLTFDPHITVLGQAADTKEVAIRLLKKLISNQKPFSVSLNKVRSQDNFFRAIYVLAEKSESLLLLHEKAKQIFNKPGNDKYMPHISLFYGEFPKEIKERIIKEIGSEYPSNFEVKSVWLYKTEGESNEWFPVQEFFFPAE